MFEKKTYTHRRAKLVKQVKSGLLLFLSNGESPMNYAANTYRYRQDSTFLYFFGLSFPGLAAVIDVDEERHTVFGDDVGMEDIIWMGPQPSLKSRCARVGVSDTRPLAELAAVLRTAVLQGRKVHFLPPYRSENALRLEQLLGIRAGTVKDYASVEFVKAVVAQRALKSAEEVGEIESALAVSAAMYREAMAMAQPGIYEREIAGWIEGIALTGGGQLAFPAIVTVHGETLHNHYHGNRLREGDLLLIDSGAETGSGYASDVTRTVPVGGRFDPVQRSVYEAVLDMQLTAIAMIRPGVSYRSIHLKAAAVLVDRLKDLGLMKGSTSEAVAAGAHALFFPHGLGHMMGLDVHDMEDLGEVHVGYDDKTQRSRQFGLAYLRLARKLEPGHVLTVEPGIYFIPALIDQWQAEKKHAAFIRYEKVEKFRSFGGMRIEDDVLVTPRGCRVLGTPIPKTVAEVEAAVRAPLGGDR
ncbi:MAG: aminopeptidase P family protein [Acidobacteria bacterium]|jgi:Xaa-Pro aminopeptidase|nr:aminopeptidase P family protein [Acidobacteriota bacterium]